MDWAEPLGWGLIGFAAAIFIAGVVISIKLHRRNKTRQAIIIGIVFILLEAGAVIAGLNFLANVQTHLLAWEQDSSMNLVEAELGTTLDQAPKKYRPTGDSISKAAHTEKEPSTPAAAEKNILTNQEYGFSLNLGEAQEASYIEVDPFWSEAEFAYCAKTTASVENTLCPPGSVTILSITVANQGQWAKQQKKLTSEIYSPLGHKNNLVFLYSRPRSEYLPGDVPTSDNYHQMVMASFKAQ